MGVKGKGLLLVYFAVLPAVFSQEPDWRKVVERLEKLEEQNKQLLSEVRALREELSGKRAEPAPPADPPPPLTERVEILEQRSAEHEQSKLETEHRMMDNVRIAQTPQHFRVQFTVDGTFGESARLMTGLRDSQVIESVYYAGPTEHE